MGCRLGLCSQQGPGGASGSGAERLSHVRRSRLTTPCPSLFERSCGCSLPSSGACGRRGALWARPVSGTVVARLRLSFSNCYKSMEQRVHIENEQADATICAAPSVYRWLRPASSRTNALARLDYCPQEPLSFGVSRGGKDGSEPCSWRRCAIPRSRALRSRCTVTSAIEAKAALRELRHKKRELKFLRSALVRRQRAARAKQSQQQQAVGVVPAPAVSRRALDPRRRCSRSPTVSRAERRARDPAEIERELHRIDETLHNIEGCILQLQGKMLTLG